MKRYVLVYNPVSGHATFRHSLDTIIEAFQRRRTILVPYRTSPGDEEQMAEFLREVQPEGVLAAGGDGTLHEVVNVLMRSELSLPIGIIGSGTSNDFATYLGVNNDLEAYFDCIVDDVSRAVDVGCANGEYFINVASAGALTSVAHEVNVRLKHAMGKMAYYLRGIGEIPKLHTLHLHIKADDTEIETGAYLFVIVNSSVAGSMQNVAVDAKIDDGKLDLLVAKDSGITEFMALAKDVVSGTIKPDEKNLLHIQAKSFLVEADEPTESDLDGERGPALPLRVETIRRAIRIYTMAEQGKDAVLEAKGE
ncbi:MAG: YegS/Rv2252/BmrU family lipid kinase [Selenomonadaceae bacterium]|nr:YegS/Rv2252/BmrU family lipid kinase [Selenomonadaceae bacterium]